MNDADGLFGPEGRFAPIHIHGTVPVTADSDTWDSLHDLLTGIALREPCTAFGLIGATREDEVRRVAEAVAGCGLRAVVLEPMCLSSALLWDVDAAVAEAVRQQMARRVLTGNDQSLLDDGMSEPEAGDPSAIAQYESADMDEP